MPKSTSSKLKKKVIISLLCGLILRGSGFLLLIVIVSQKSDFEPNSPKQNNHNLPTRPGNPPSPSNKTKKEIIKIKKINDNSYALKTWWERKDGGGSSEATFSKENFLHIIQEYYEEKGETGWKKEILVNCQSELKDNLWLVKQKAEIIGEPGSFSYSTYYENDHGEKK